MHNMVRYDSNLLEKKKTLIQCATLNVNLSQHSCMYACVYVRKWVSSVL